MSGIEIFSFVIANFARNKNNLRKNSYRNHKNQYSRKILKHTGIFFMGLKHKRYVLFRLEKFLLKEFRLWRKVI